jgi:DNA polymerase V
MTRGGARKGAGRPKGKEPTQAIRLPLSVINALQDHLATDFKLPLYLNKISAGFPSPAEDYIADRLSLNEFLIKHPAATFLVRATGHSMLGAGIHDNDVLIVDRSIKPTHGKIVIAAVDGQLTVKRLHQEGNRLILMPENPKFEPIEIKDGNEVMIWGVVIHVIHSV